MPSSPAAFFAKTVLKGSTGVYRIATVLKLNWDKWSCTLQRTGKKLCSSYSTVAQQGWLNLAMLSKIWSRKIYLSGHSCVSDYYVVLFMLSAWQRSQSVEHPVQLEGLSQANWKHLYWGQPGVRVCPLHRPFPAVWRKCYTWNSEDRGIWATDGCLSPWATHWNSISSTPQHQ